MLLTSLNWLIVLTLVMQTVTKIVKIFLLKIGKTDSAGMIKFKHGKLEKELSMTTLNSVIYLLKPFNCVNGITFTIFMIL